MGIKITDEMVDAAMAKKPEDITTEDKIVLFKAMGQTDSRAQQMRIDFAAEQGELLKPILREESFIETIFKRDDTNGEQRNYPIRSKKVRAAWNSTGTDSVPSRIAEQKDTQFNTYWLEAAARWKLDHLKQGNVGLVDRQMTDMMDNLAYKVNFAGMALIKTAEILGDISTIATITGGNKLTLNVIEKIMTFLEKRTEGANKVTDIFLSVNRYNELVTLSNFASSSSTSTTDSLSIPEQERQKIYAGGLDGISNIYLSNFGVRLHKIRKTEFVNDGKCYAFDVNNFGVMPVDENLETMADNAAANRYETGIQARQKQGFGITNVDSGVVYDFDIAGNPDSLLISLGSPGFFSV